jgi:CubicO group peptidase (beta-lactamase class C family)
MKQLLILQLLILFSESTLFAQQNTSIHIPDSDTIEVWLKSNNVPAVGIGTIEDGRLNRIIVQGELKEASSAPYNTIFDVASLTKSIVTILTLKLISNNEWDLDEPLFHYWVDPDVKDSPLYKQLTTRHVLSHRTGFVNWRRMHETKKLTFDFEPGTKFQYSGEGFEYLRKALESKFGTSLNNLSDSLIFSPFKMKDSNFIWNNNVDSTRLAIGHNELGKPYEYIKSFTPNAADNLLTTIEDFGKFGMDVINQVDLTDEVFNEMISTQSEVREKIDFGLGWIIFNDLPNGEYALFNAGSDTGVNAIILLLPISKRGLIVMTNGDQGRALVMKIIGETMGEVGREILGRF